MTKDTHEENDLKNTTNDEDDVVYDEDESSATSVKKLRIRIKELEKEKQEYLDGWQRMKADVVNRDRAAAEERSRVSSMVKEKILEDLLPVLDAFDAAFTGAAWEKVDTNWRVGIEYIHAQFKKVLEENGIQAYGAAGDVFDPMKHDLAEELQDGGISGTIAKVLRQGYEMEGRVLRPARVNISKA
ncbi:MAG: hypothetical protein RI911_318 [Candidatus Parcubacteria bacterium]|jgi:molecular chaperone GrpE